LSKSKKNLYLCAENYVDFMTIEIGDTSFATLMNGLRQQIDLLKVRCIDAEAEVSRLQTENAEHRLTISELERNNRELTEKYNGLQAGVAHGTSVEEVENLRNRYLAMIREIDLCLSKLNG